MEVNGLLSLKDIEGIHVDQTLSDFDKLLLIAEVASSKYEAQEKEEKKYKRKEANHRMKRSNKRRKLDMATLPMPPPELPEEFKERIKALGGTQVEMVIEKALYPSDWDTNKCRLSMPFGKAKEGFLTEEESTHLAKPKETIIVPFIEPSGKCDKMTLGRWDMKKSSIYVLKTHWNMVLKENGLGQNDVVQVWSFRVGTEQQLCLALVVVSSSGCNHGGRDGGEAEEDAGTSYKAN
ncbi:B3 domain-containing protein At2g31420-like [Corylus avellana]|uniref:B3 domain-containing protein At2g31420-like n=1 Tax=Corylus avellana TaxID=13451 RepID=UPI00286CFCC0|nr:B3 domain-containing protein At2g31420-like [Corylus avellana]